MVGVEDTGAWWGLGLGGELWGGGSASQKGVMALTH